MRTIGKVAWIVFALIVPAAAQNYVAAGVAPAAAGPTFNVSAGYANLTMGVTSAQRVNLNGLDVAGHVELTPRWGAMLDSTYARTSNMLGTRHAGYQLSLLGGPVFYPIVHEKTRVFVHALAGGALVDGAVPINQSDYFHGWVVRFSYAAGGGIERALSGPFSVRLRGDYLRSSFFDAHGAVRPEDNLRLTASLVFRLNQRNSKGL